MNNLVESTMKPQKRKKIQQYARATMEAIPAVSGTPVESKLEWPWNPKCRMKCSCGNSYSYKNLNHNILYLCRKCGAVYRIDFFEDEVKLSSTWQQIGFAYKLDELMAISEKDEKYNLTFEEL